MANTNDQLVLICGPSASGKSASLRNILNPEGVMYFNCEAGKKLPFPTKFKQGTVVEPYQVHKGFEKAETKPNIHTLIVDSITFLMDMFETQHVYNAADTMKGWANFAQYFKTLMQYYVPSSKKTIIMTAHVQTILNESDMVLEKKVPIKGSLKANGVESYFSTVIASKVMPVEKLEPYSNKLLTITPEEEAVGIKYVFQTKLTKETVNERIRSSMGMWDTSETFIDNDIQLVMNRLKEYYN